MEKSETHTIWNRSISLHWRACVRVKVLRLKAINGSQTKPENIHKMAIITWEGGGDVPSDMYRFFSSFVRSLAGRWKWSTLDCTSFKMRDFVQYSNEFTGQIDEYARAINTSRWKKHDLNHAIKILGMPDWEPSLSASSEKMPLKRERPTEIALTQRFFHWNDSHSELTRNHSHLTPHTHAVHPYTRSNHIFQLYHSRFEWIMWCIHCVRRSVYFSPVLDSNSVLRIGGQRTKNRKLYGSAHPRDELRVPSRTKDKWYGFDSRLDVERSPEHCSGQRQILGSE